MHGGARGYVLNDMNDEDIERAVLAVGNGEAIFSPAIATRMITFFSARPDLPPEIFPELTESERNVLRLMAQGANNDAIAQQQSLSRKTIRNYVSNIFSKLQSLIVPRPSLNGRHRDEWLRLVIGNYGDMPLDFGAQVTIQIQEKSFDTGKVTPNYAESSSSGRPLVLLHGGSARWQDLSRILFDLATAYSVFAPDLRGHGRSGWVSNHYRLQDYDDDIIVFIQADPLLGGIAMQDFAPHAAALFCKGR